MAGDNSSRWLDGNWPPRGQPGPWNPAIPDGFLSLNLVAPDSIQISMEDDIRINAMVNAQL